MRGRRLHSDFEPEVWHSQSSQECPVSVVRLESTIEMLNEGLQPSRETFMLRGGLRQDLL